MKANEFVKKFGWDRAKREVALIGTIAMMCGDNDFNNDLKRLVESHELIKEHGSIVRAKMYAESAYTAPEVVDRLKQAIADVESCLEVSSESN